MSSKGNKGKGEGQGARIDKGQEGGKDKGEGVGVGGLETGYSLDTLC